MKRSVLILLVLLCFSCSNEDDVGIDCSLFDPAFPSLYVRLVDSTGTNLIENGTIDPNNIRVEGDFSGAGFQFVPANEFAEPDAEIRELNNTIQLFMPNRSSFQYTLFLDDLEPFDVNFTAERMNIPCDLHFYQPIEADASDEALYLREIPPLQFLVVLEL